MANMYAMTAGWEEMGYAGDEVADSHRRVWRHPDGARCEVWHFPGCRAKKTVVKFVGAEPHGAPPVA